MTILGRKYGTHDPSEWLEEGAGLLASARAIRAQWWILRRKFSRKSDQGQVLFSPRPSEMTRLVGLPRASMLLLGYSAEMYLKSGLIRIYTGCDEAVINSEVKKFGHNFVGIAKEISYPTSQKIKDRLIMLQRCVQSDARYPIEISQVSKEKIDVEYANRVNCRTRIMWDSTEFSALCDLVKSIRAHVQRIDGDCENPTSFRRLDLSHGGYLVLRDGGNLQSRITYRPEDGKKEMRTVSEIQQLLIDAEWIEAKHYWNRFVVMEITKKNHLVNMQLQ
jgi:hypothetical protein